MISLLHNVVNKEDGMFSVLHQWYNNLDLRGWLSMPNNHQATLFGTLQQLSSQIKQCTFEKDEIPYGASPPAGACFCSSVKLVFEKNFKIKSLGFGLSLEEAVENACKKLIDNLKYF